MLNKLPERDFENELNKENPDFEKLKKIADRLGTKYGWVIFTDDEPIVWERNDVAIWAMFDKPDGEFLVIEVKGPDGPLESRHPNFKDGKAISAAITSLMVKYSEMPRVQAKITIQDIRYGKTVGENTITEENDKEFVDIVMFLYNCTHVKLDQTDNPAKEAVKDKDMVKRILDLVFATTTPPS